MYYSLEKYEIGCMPYGTGFTYYFSPFLRAKCQNSEMSLSEFPCFIVYAARDIRSIPDTMWRYYMVSSILLERQQQDVRSSLWLFYKAPDVPVNTMTALAVEVGESTLHYSDVFE